MQNKRQIDKNLKSDKLHSNPLRIIVHRNEQIKALKICIDEIAYIFGEKTDILKLALANIHLSQADTPKALEVI